MRRLLAALAVICFFAVPAVLRSQEVTVFDRKVQFHGFASLGFIHTDGNNWLTMNTNGVGSGEFTDGALNASVQITDRFRIGGRPRIDA